MNGHYGTMIALLMATPVSAHDFKVGPLLLDHPWSRATPPGAEIGAGYLAITNTGAEPDRLLSGTTPAAGKLEIHMGNIEGGVMKMRPAEGGVELPVGMTVTLAPGGTHTMLVGLVTALKEGSTIPVSLNFERAGTVTVDFKVEGFSYRPALFAVDHRIHDVAP